MNDYKNPWLGLESYHEGEILYGRDEDIRDLSQCVLNDHDTLLYGKSGIGKSSILNAGVIPAARRQDFLPIIFRLSHKGDKTYTQQIIEAVTEAMLTQSSVAAIPNAASELIREIIKSKNPEKETVYEYFHRHEFYSADGERQKLLIIFDQFEEIFTLQSDEISKKEFFAELADFLNDVMPNYLLPQKTAPATARKGVVISSQNFKDILSKLTLDIAGSIPEYVADNEIHMVFTIREDFLSEFEYYTSAIPSLKQNRYGLRPLNEEQAAQIILRPRPGLINKEVAELIIQKITGRTDFKLDGIPEIEVDSAMLSLYLNRLYDAANGEQITANLVEQKMGEIISDFYEEAISNVSNKVIEYFEEHLLNGQGHRDNITVYDAIVYGQASQEDIEILCNQKKILRQFNYSGDLRIEYIHDILCPVVLERKTRREILLQQEQERKAKEAENARLLEEAEAKRKSAEAKALEEKRQLEFEREKNRQKNNIEYNCRELAANSNVLNYNGRQLIDNALDFGEYRTCYAFTDGNTADTFTVFPKLQISLLEQLSIEDIDFVNPQVFTDPLLKDHTCELSFSKDGAESPTIDGIYSVRVSYNSGRISKIMFYGKRVINGVVSYHHPIYISGGYCGMSIDYDESGKTEIRTYLDENEKPIINQDGYSIIKTIFDECGNPIKRRYFKEHMGCMVPAVHVHGNHGFDSFFDDNRNEIKRVFVAEDGTPAKITNGVYGKVMEYDPYSFKLISLSNIDASGSLMADVDGYVTEKYQYDSDGRLVCCLNYDIYGNPIKDVDGIYGNKYEYNEDGGILTQKCIDSEYRYMVNKNGEAGNVVFVNDKKQIVKFYSIDADGEILEKDDRQSITVLTYNDQNRILSFKFFDKENKFVSGYLFEYYKEGTHVRYMFSLNVFEMAKYEETGTEGIEFVYKDNHYLFTSFVDASKNHVRHKDGFYAMVKQNDSQGRLTEMRYLNLDGQPMPDNDGVYGLRNVYSENGIMTQTYIDANGFPMEDANGLGITIVDNHSMSVACYNKDMKPILWNGWHKKVNEKTQLADGIVNKTYKTDLDNNIVVDDGVAFLIEIYDTKGRIVKRYWQDVAGRMTPDSSGCVCVKWSYDDENQIEIEDRYSADNKIAIHRVVYKDGYGRLIKDVWFDSNNQPMQQPDIWAFGVERKYDDAARTKTTTFINELGKPTNNKKNYAIQINWYDSYGRPIAEKKVDENGSIQGYITFKEYVEDKSTANGFYLHEEDVDGTVVVNGNGLTYDYYELDEFGRILKNLFFDANKNPICNEEGDFGLACEYTDDYVVRICLDEYGEPHNNRNGYGRVHIYQDAEERDVKRQYYSKDGHPVQYDKGCYGVVFKYPSQYSRITGYLDEKGEITTNSDGYAFREDCHDPETEADSVFFYDVNRNNTQSLEDDCKDYGYAIVVDDDHRNIVSLGKSGAITTNACGYSRKKEVYRDGKLCFLLFIDNDGKPVPDTVGDYGTEYQYSDDSSVVRQISLNQKGEMHINNYGYCLCEAFTAIHGDKIRLYYDNKGNQVIPRLSNWRKLHNAFKQLLKSKILKQQEKPILNCRQLGAVDDVLLCNVETKGLAKKRHLSGLYVLLEYDNWSFGDNHSNIEEKIKNGRFLSKHLVLMPICIEEATVKSVGDPIGISFPKGKLGIRFMSWRINVYTKQILSEKYKLWTQKTT